MAMFVEKRRDKQNVDPMAQFERQLLFICIIKQKMLKEMYKNQK